MRKLRNTNFFGVIVGRLKINIIFVEYLKKMAWVLSC